MLPWAGSVRTTCPAATPSANSSPASKGSKPASRSAWNASSRLLPRTSGTGVGGGPFDRTMVTASPTLAWLPGFGVNDTTAPSGTSLLYSSVSSETRGSSCTASMARSASSTEAPGRTSGTTGLPRESTTVTSSP